MPLSVDLLTRLRTSSATDMAVASEDALSSLVPDAIAALDSALFEAESPEEKRRIANDILDHAGVGRLKHKRDEERARELSINSEVIKAALVGLSSLLEIREKNVTSPPLQVPYEEIT